MFKVGITGHRYLKPNCINHYQKEVSKLLKKLQQKHKDIVIYSPLADGADRLIVNEAIKLNIPYIAILPMPKENYIMDFDKNSKQEFELLLNNANDIMILPLCKGSTIESIATYTKERDLQYEAVGHKIADISDNLIALWDKKDIGLIGGTGEIVKYFKNKKLGILSHLMVSRSKDKDNFMVKFKHFNMECEKWIVKM